MEHIIKISDKKVYNSLIAFLKTLGIDIDGGKNKKRKVAANRYPLEGTLIKYDHPFEPATDVNNWEAAK
jgi:hypothetical protein